MSKNHYEVLGLPMTATKLQIKEAYRRAILQSHPDKRKKSSAAIDSQFFNIKTAFDTLIDDSLRKNYDKELTSSPPSAVHSTKSTPRPAHIVSLDEFNESQTADGLRWSYPCRCGNFYVLLEVDLENDIHTVFCDGCSESLYAGYELEAENS